jgi:hAT family C-terminal dimerisation region
LDDNHPLAKDAIHHWMSQKATYPRLAKMAFDILTIPASSADCERMFSELGDLLEVRRMKMRPYLISAIQCNKA